MSRSQNKEEDAAYARSYYARRKADPERHRRYLDTMNRRNLRLRREILDAYGGKCECCGVTDWQFLTIEHREGGGSAHRLSRGVRSVYREIRKAGFPPEYGLLCWNCNAAKGIHGGCPHAL